MSLVIHFYEDFEGEFDALSQVVQDECFTLQNPIIKHFFYAENIKRVNIARRKLFKCLLSLLMPLSHLCQESELIAK